MPVLNKVKAAANNVNIVEAAKAAAKVKKADWQKTFEGKSVVEIRKRVNSLDKAHSRAVDNFRNDKDPGGKKRSIAYNKLQWAQEALVKAIKAESKKKPAKKK